MTSTRPVGSRHQRQRKSVWARWSTRFAVVCATLALFGAGVYAQFYAGPGYATWQDKTSTMVRQIGFGPLLDAYENWLYTRHAPSDSPPDLKSLGAIATSSPARVPSYSGLPPLTTASAGTGRWHAVQRVPGVAPAVYTALLQPDPAHRSVVVAVALVRSSEVSAHLMPGTEQPPGTGSPGTIPPAQVADLVAAFNSGFKATDQPGGFYLDGVTVNSLVAGQASAVIDDRGHLSIGQWGRDVTMGPQVRAVRQNLALIVEGGRAVPGLDRNTDQRWGGAHNQLQYTWRSALGVTAQGDLLYVAGDQLNLATLGTALAQAGAVTGMELDMHPGMEFFNSWRADGSGQPQPQRLMPAMVGPVDRYVRADIRDFFYFTMTDGPHATARCATGSQRGHSG